MIVALGYCAFATFFASSIFAAKQLNIKFVPATQRVILYFTGIKPYKNAPIIG